MDESEVTGEKSTPEKGEENGDSPNEDEANTSGGTDNVEENKPNID